MNPKETGKTYLQKLQTFAYLCLGVPLLFFIYIYLESSVDRLEPVFDPGYNWYIFIPTFSLALFLIFFGGSRYNSAREMAMNQANFKDKLKVYQNASNTRFLFYGISTSFITLGFYFTNFKPFAVMFGFMIVLFSINNPSARKIVGALKLKDEEKKIILAGLEIS
jgi:hypothetical protein